MRSHTSFARSLAIGAFTLVPGLLMSGAAVAQEGTPIATPGGPSEGYPVAIHQGTCADLTAEAAFEIGDAVTFGLEGEGAEGEVQTVGSGEALPLLLQASGTVDSTLEDLGSQGHAVAVHASQDEYETIVACGDIAGIINGGRLAIALAPVDGSSVVGVAILEGEDQLEATVYVFDTQNAGGPTPEA
jgi:hypothetical protein